jgi:hypothetical protein
MLEVDLTSVALGSIFAEIAKEDIDKLIEWLAQLSVIVESGVQSVGPPADYALVWEWGNVRQTKKGPKTTKGTNPDGKKVWLTIQAPRGWISINEPKIWKAIDDEISKIKFDSQEDITEDSLKEALTEAYRNIAEKALSYLQQTVPIDSGDLYDSLKVVEPNDEILKELNDLSSDIVSEIGTLNI